MDVHPTKNVSIGIEPYPVEVSCGCRLTIYEAFGDFLVVSWLNLLAVPLRPGDARRHKKTPSPVREPTMWCPSSLAKLVPITSITMVYGRYIELVNGVYI